MRYPYNAASLLLCALAVVSQALGYDLLPDSAPWVLVVAAAPLGALYIDVLTRMASITNQRGPRS